MYYTPFRGNLIPIWNGSGFMVMAFSELSDALSETTYSPAAAVANSCYDWFVWSNAGTLVLSRGPVYTGTGTSSGRSSAIARVQGIWTNSVSITNGPGAGYGTYVGTGCTDKTGVGLTNATFNYGAGGGTSGANNNPGIWAGIWNAYNRIGTTIFVQDNTTSWNYTSASWRNADNSANMSLTVVQGLSEDPVKATYQVYAGGSGVHCETAIAFNGGITTNGATGGYVGNGTIASVVATLTNYSGNGAEGTYQASEYGGTTCTFSGYVLASAHYIDMLSADITY